MYHYEIIKLYNYMVQTKTDDLLYLKQKDLFQKKQNIESEINKYYSIIKNTETSSITFFPDSDFMYSFYLERSSLISLLLYYKHTNTQRYKNQDFSKKQDLELINKCILSAIKENPTISYLELIELGTKDDETEMNLEAMIENNIITYRKTGNSHCFRIR